MSALPQNATGQNATVSNDSEVSFTVMGGLGLIRLERPKALNALTQAQIHAIAPQLAAWTEDPRITVIAIEGAGDKAFCAGGDIRALHDAGRAGDRAAQAEFYREEYRLNRQIKTCPKPYIALIDGITMGGGVGLSVHGRYRVASERTLFAMPETGIGFYPDVGGTYFLPRCPSPGLGLFLGLTGARLKTADALFAGIATHVVPAAGLAELKAALAEVTEPADAAHRVPEILQRAHQDPGPAPLVAHAARIARLFAEAPDLDAVYAGLAADDDPWAAEQLKVLAQKSPLALAVTFRQLREGTKLDFDAAMRLEFRLSMHLAPAHDFLEGIRAVIIDKDNSPRWQPARRDLVTPEMVDACFAATEFGELAFD